MSAGRKSETTGTPTRSAMTAASPVCQVVVIFRAGDGRYLIDGPFAWPSEPASRAIDRPWYRDVRGNIPREVGSDASVAWVRADEGEGGWPRCFLEAASWRCWGMQPSTRGVVVVSVPGGRLWWAQTTASGAGELRSASWGRRKSRADPASKHHIKWTVSDARLTRARLHWPRERAAICAVRHISCA